MAYVVSLAEQLTYLTPNFIWEYIKEFLYNHTRVKVAPPHALRREDVYEIYKEEIALLKKASTLGLNPERIRRLKDPPEWLDPDKLVRGQEFAKDFYFSVSYSNLISLYLLFSHDRSLRPLIFTRRSGDVESAYRRYMSTIHRVKSWYEEDLTDVDSAARKNLRKVNNYHLSISSKLNSMEEEEFVRRSTLDGERIESDNGCCERIRRVLAGNGVDATILGEMDSSMHLSQSHMAVTQFGFMGLIVLYPEAFGVPSSRDLECFVHLWSYIGYLLGIEDEFNLCRGTVPRVRRKCSAVLECVLKPCMSQANASWEHMSICACRGINRALKKLNFETTLAFLMDCIGLNFDSFYYSMTLKARLKYHMIKFMFRYVVPVDNKRNHLNSAVHHMLETHKIFS